MRRDAIKFLLLMLFLLLPIAEAHAQEPEWLRTMKSIEPLEFNRRSVRSIYGEPAIAETDADYFDIKEGRIKVQYSPARCAEAFNGKWNVESDTVISLGLSVAPDIDFSTISFKSRGFILEVPDDTPQLRIYRNFKTGIEFEVTHLNFISYVRIKPPKSKSRLSCE